MRELWYHCGSMRNMIRNVRESAGPAYTRVNARLGGIPDIVRDALMQFGRVRAASAAASLAYYALFSLFPLLILLVTIGSLLFDSTMVAEGVTDLVQRFIPVSQELTEAAIHQMITPQGAVQIIGLLGLLWAATGFFAGLVSNVRLAWYDTKPLSLFQMRLMALIIIAVLMVLMLLSLVSGLFVALLPEALRVLLAQGLEIVPGTWNLITRLVFLLLSTVLFLGLYRWVPSAHVSWRAGLAGAIFTALGLQLATLGFSWYLTSGLAGYRLYGSLEAVVVLLFWIYLSTWIALFGAHLAAAVDRRK